MKDVFAWLVVVGVAVTGQWVFTAYTWPAVIVTAVLAVVGVPLVRWYLWRNDRRWVAWWRERDAELGVTVLAFLHYGTGPGLVPSLVEEADRLIGDHQAGLAAARHIRAGAN